MKKERNSNIELLRLISIFLIVLSHSVQHAVIDVNTLEFGFNKIVLEFFSTGHLGVVIFLLISGYCGIKRSKHNWNSIWYFVLRVFSYSSIIYIVMLLTGNINFSIIMLIKNLLPIIFNKYWFVTAFFIFNLFTPYLNKLLKGMSKREFKIYLFLNLFLCFIISFFSMQEICINEVIQFIIFYSLGAYLRLFPNNFVSNKYKMIFSVTILFEIISLIGLNFLASYYPIFNHGLYLTARNSVFTILIAICIVQYFVNLKPKVNTFVNNLALTSFGIYLLHDNEYIRQLIWGKLFITSNYFNVWYCIFIIIGVSIIVFIMSMIIDFIKVNTLDILLKKISNKMNFVTNKVLDRIGRE